MALTSRQSTRKRDERRSLGVRRRHTIDALAAGAVVLEAQGEHAAAAVPSGSALAAGEKPPEARQQRSTGASRGQLPVGCVNSVRVVESPDLQESELLDPARDLARQRDRRLELGQGPPDDLARDPQFIETINLSL